MNITKDLLLEKLTALRDGNIEAMQNEDISDEMIGQEEAIRDTFDIVEVMFKDLPDPIEKQYNPATVGELIRYLSDYNPNTKMTAVFWQEDDIRIMNKDSNGNDESDEEFKGIPLTDEEVTKVLRSLNRCHNPEHGINWVDIETTIEYIREDK